MAAIVDQDNQVLIKVFDLIDSPFAVSSDDGHKVYDAILPVVRQGHKVQLSFEKIEIIIPAFLNAAVGPLYGDFQEDEIGKLIELKGLAAGNLELVKHVVDNAKLYFAHREEFDRAWQEELG